ncbi:bifunctional DNA primase/polymerase [Streptomyces sp. ODS28]|uniref:bifunctional DNA primase/polymerase n=1 Tax=Streptomyces sp. ODS28 TaxID=3136688 RepID=UPI0031EDE3B8
MREILGRRRMTRSSLRDAALTCATRWQWPVVPGAALAASPASADAPQPQSKRRSRKGSRGAGSAAPRPAAPACSCPDPGCVVPGAHPFDPVLLAATTDARMVRWWWTNRPQAPVILATGGSAPCALSLPAVAGARALAEFDRLGVRTGPVVATPTRFSLLVAPYRLEELGDLLYACDWVPSSLRFHGTGGYVALPPSQTGPGQVRWERQPAVSRETGGKPFLPRMESLLETLVEASATAPDPETLSY